jgi:hypothetical protein
MGLLQFKSFFGSSPTENSKVFSFPKTLNLKVSKVVGPNNLKGRIPCALPVGIYRRG